MLNRLFRPKPALAAGRALYARAVEQARQPALYTDLGCPDTNEGRFEVYTLHVMLLLDRLRGQGAQATEVNQGLFDTYVKALDHALREMGVGDLGVGRKMRKLGEAFYGRGKSYDAAFKALPDRTELDALLARTVYADVEAAALPKLADYVLTQREALAEQPLETLLAGNATWRPL